MRYYTAEEVAGLVHGAVEKIGQYSSGTIFVKAERARTKGSKLEPTDNQIKLLRYITTHEWISFEETLGMDWRFLGGLFTRGLIEWRSQGGVVGVASTREPRKGK